MLYFQKNTQLPVESLIGVSLNPWLMMAISIVSTLAGVVACFWSKSKAIQAPIDEAEESIQKFSQQAVIFKEEFENNGRKLKGAEKLQQ